MCSFFQSSTVAFNCYKLQYLLTTILFLDNVGAFFFLTMTRKPTRLTHINATINRHDVLYPSEKSFATVHRVRLDLACHSFSTKVKGFLLKNFHFLANQGILFTAYPAADAQFFTLVKLKETSLRSRFGERLRSIRMRNNTPKLPVVQHFNSTGHSISDFQVCGAGMAVCSGTDIQPKQREMRVFLQLGTVQTLRAKYQFQLHSLLFTRARASFLCL